MLQWSVDSLAANLGVTRKAPHTRDDVAAIEDYVYVGSMYARRFGLDLAPAAYKSPLGETQSCRRCTAPLMAKSWSGI